MNYYIDFDNTMYNTGKLLNRMYKAIASEIVKQNKTLDEEGIIEECKNKFGKENITDIYELAKYFANKYNLNLDLIIKAINAEILNSNDLVFNDVIPFLNRLKEKGHKLFIFSYGGKNAQYQSLKIVGSGIANYFDGIYLSANLKYELDINYSDGIFIDDNPRDLLGIYSKNPKEVIRIRRPENKYSVKDIENTNIKEYKSFDDILI